MSSALSSFIFVAHRADISVPIVSIQRCLEFSVELLRFCCTSRRYINPRVLRLHLKVLEFSFKLLPFCCTSRRYINPMVSGYISRCLDFSLKLFARFVAHRAGIWDSKALFTSSGVKEFNFTL